MDELTIDQAHAAFRSGTFSARQLVEHFLGRITSLDQAGPRINSILAVSAEALEQADKIDKHWQETSQFVGPLHGIPVLVKDQADTKGIVTTYGSQVFKENVPTEDSTVVKKLKDAGVIVLAKTTLPDWATSWHSTSSVSGVTKNPFALDRDPGGSSSGTGAAIAADFAILGVGEDTGGSIRLPSSFCGLVGLRCTPGMISRTGLAPLVVHQDTPGPMTRTVRDAALMLDVMVGFDIDDPYTTSSAIAGKPQGGSYAANLDHTKVRYAKLGVLRSAFGSNSDAECRAVNDVIEAALECLRAAGTTIVDIDIPGIDQYISDSSLYSIQSRHNIDKFLAKKMPGITCERIKAEKLYHPNLDLFEELAAGPVNPTDDPTYAKRLEAHGEFQRLVMGIIVDRELDAIVFPDCQIPAPLMEDVLSSRWGALDFPTNTLIASQARLPAITLPVGFTESGLPVGMELLGLLYQEQHLLELAYGVEGLMKARRAPSLPRSC